MVKNIYLVLYNGVHLLGVRSGCVFFRPALPASRMVASIYQYKYIKWNDGIIKS